MELAGRKIAGKCPRTKTWYDYETLKVGKAQVPDGGKFDLVARPRDAGKWKALNIRSIKLTKVE